MTKIFWDIYYRILKIVPNKIGFYMEYMHVELISLVIYYIMRVQKFPSSISKIKNDKINILGFGNHPYTTRILKNGLKRFHDKINLIYFGDVYDIYKDISGNDRINFKLLLGGNYDCYKKLGEYHRQLHKDFFDNINYGALDFNLPIQYFDKNIKKIIYLNHRFSYTGYFNHFKIKDREKILNDLKDENSILIAADNFDYEFHKYFLGNEKEILVIPPLVDPINDKYEGINNEFLIVPGKGWIYKGRETIIDNCIDNLVSSGLKVSSITRKYKNKRYEFKEIAQYKALIVIPYTVYTGSIVDFLDMGMPMFFPSVKFLANMHKEHNVLYDHDFFSSYKHIKIQKSFLNKIINLASLKNKAPNPFDYEDLEGLEYRISKAGRYSEWPIITYDSFEDLSFKLKKTNFKEYSKKLLEFNESQKIKSIKNWEKLLNSVIFVK